MLNKDNTDKKFIVYNRGVPGNTSSKLLNRLERDLLECHPQIVIILIGENDSKVIQDSNFALIHNKKLTGHLFFYLSELRSYKLLKVIKEKIEVAIWMKKLSFKFMASDFLPKGRNNEKDNLVQNFEKINKDSYDALIERAEKNFNDYERNKTLAVEKLKSAIELEPCSVKAHYLLGNLYTVLEKYNLGIEELKYALLLQPDNASIYKSLFYTYYQAGNTILAKETLEKYLYLDPSAIPKFLPLLRNKMPYVKDDELFSDLYKFNLKKIITECKKNKSNYNLTELSK